MKRLILPLPTVTLRKIAGGWNVAAFENKFNKMDSLTGR